MYRQLLFGLILIKNVAITVLQIKVAGYWLSLYQIVLLAMHALSVHLWHLLPHNTDSAMIPALPALQYTE